VNLNSDLVPTCGGLSLVKLVNLAERLQELKETVEKVTAELAEDLDEQPPHR
jgi:hypothetical protein